MSSTEHRLGRLEDIEALRGLKARYLNACDRKDAEALAACFAPGDILIDYGHVGRFENREAFVELFAAAADHPHVLDMHHGANPELEIVGPNEAEGRWSFDYRNVNTEERSIMLASGFYDDRYQRIEGGWVMRETVVTYVSAMRFTYTDQAIASVFAGRSVAGVVDYG